MAIGAIGAALIVIAAKVATDPLVQSETPAEAVTLVREESIDASRSVQITVQDVARNQVFSLSLQGVVTRISEGEIEGGTSPLSINDKPIFVYVGDSPIWGDVSDRDSGPSAQRVCRTLTSVLAVASLLPGAEDCESVPNSYSRELIRAFNGMLGRTNDTRTVYAADLLWLGEPRGLTTTQLEASVSVGDVIGFGDPIYVGEVVSATVQVVDSQQSEAIRSRTHLLSAFGTAVPYLPGQPLDQSAQLQLAESALRDTRSDPSAEIREEQGTATLEDPLETTVVPTAALVTGDGGEVCLIERLGEARTLTRVEPLFSVSGSTWLEGQIVAEEVLLPDLSRSDLDYGCD